MSSELADIIEIQGPVALPEPHKALLAGKITPAEYVAKMQELDAAQDDASSSRESVRRRRVRELLGARAAA